MSTETKVSVGKELKSARRSKGWSVERAAYATKLRADVITKIESDRYDLLPNPAYARGFVRIYARELGLDPFPILKRLNGVVDEADETSELLPETLESLPKPVKRQGAHAQNIGLFIVMMVIFGGLLIGGIQLYRIWPMLFGSKNSSAPSLSELTKPIEVKEKKETESSEEVRKAEVVADAAPAAEDMTVKRAEPLTVSAANNKLQLSADEECWVKVTSVNGGKETVVFEDVIPAGATMPADNAWTADAFIVAIRDTAKVNIIYNGQNFGKYDRQGYQTFRIPAN